MHGDGRRVLTLIYPACTFGLRAMGGEGVRTRGRGLLYRASAQLSSVRCFLTVTCDIGHNYIETCHIEIKMRHGYPANAERYMIVIMIYDF